MTACPRVCLLGTAPRGSSGFARRIAPSSGGCAWGDLSRTATIAAGRSATLKVKPKGARKAATAAFKKIKNAVKKRKKVTATISVKIVDVAGNTRNVKRTVKLTR